MKLSLLTLPNDGKRGGAYSWGTYGAHPFVLLNYAPTTNDIEMRYARPLVCDEVVRHFRAVILDVEIAVQSVERFYGKRLALHCLHSYYSMSAQPYEKADYQIFVAEVASTTNEMLLGTYLLNNVADVDMRRYLLSYRLDQFRTSLGNTSIHPSVIALFNSPTYSSPIGASAFLTSSHASS